MSKKEILKEGFFDYLGNILKRTNEKRFIKGLSKIEKSGPAGKKAVAQFKKRAAQLQNDMEAVNKWLD